ncbi:Ribokinase-like protein [Pholiota molesta]|nr:Ribokinase-like protein [Pholiota molesta]
MASTKTQNTCTIRGSINHDEYFHVSHIAQPGETISSHTHESRVGGKGANQAVAIVRAGGQARFYGAVGPDGVWVKERMGEYGIDVEGILVSDEPTGRAIIQVDEHGENSISKSLPRSQLCRRIDHAWGDAPLVLFPGANFSEAHERAFAARGAGWFPATSHLLLQNEIHPRALHYALAHGAAAGACVVLNPSPLPAPAEVRAFPWRAVKWLVVNAAEARGLYLALAQADAAEVQALEPRAVLGGLAAQPALSTTNVVCTLGAQGVLACLPGLRGAGEEEPPFVYVPAARLRAGVQDTTGAGDCFTGYFVQGLMALEGEVGAREIEQVLKTCVVAAGMCCEKRGTIDSIPIRAEVEERMASSDP